MRPRVDSMPSLETKVSGTNRQETHRKPSGTWENRNFQTLNGSLRCGPVSIRCPLWNLRFLGQPARKHTGNPLGTPKLQNAQRELKMRPRVDSMPSLETKVSGANRHETHRKLPGNPLGTPKLQNAQRELKMRPHVDSLPSLETKVSGANPQKTHRKSPGNPATSKRSTGT